MTTQTQAPARKATTTKPKPLDEATRLLKAGYWPVAIYPPDTIISGREPTKGKEPIGREWGLQQWTAGKLRRAFEGLPRGRSRDMLRARTCARWRLAQ